MLSMLAIDDLVFELKKLCNRVLQKGNQQPLYPGTFVQYIPSKRAVVCVASYSLPSKSLYNNRKFIRK